MPLTRRAPLFLAAAVMLLAASVLLSAHDAASPAVQAAAEVVAVVVLARAARHVGGPAGRPWALLAVALGMWAAIDIVAAVTAVDGGEPAASGVFDAAWLLAYVPMAAGVLMIYRRLRPGSGWDAVLDTVVIVVMLGVLAWELALEPAYSGGGDPRGVLVNLLYPLVDLLLVGLLAWLVWVLASPPPWLVALLAAAAVQWGASVAFLVSEAGGSPAADRLSTVLYTAGALAWASAGGIRLRRPAAEPVREARARPRTLPGVLAMGVLAVSLTAGVGLDDRTVAVVAGLTLGVIAVRVGIMATTSVRATEALRESEDRHRSLLSAMADGVVQRFSDGRPGMCNAAAERILGLTSAELTGTVPIDGIWHTLDHEGRVLDPAERPSVVTLRTGEVMRDRVMGIVHKDGTQSWISVNTEPLRAGRDQVPYGVVASFSDVTGRRAAEDALRLAGSRLAALVENLQGGVLVEDRQRRIAVVNQTFCDTFSIPAPPAALVGADCAGAAEASAPMLADPEGFVTRIAEVLDAGEIVVGEQVLFSDGRVFERDYIPVAGPDGVALGRMWMYRDVTERAQAAAELAEARDAALAASRAKSSFLATMSHEIRTPLSALVALIELLRDGGLDPGQQELVRMIDQSAERLLTVIEDVLDFSKIEAGAMELESAPFVPAEVLEQAAGLFSSQAQAKGLAMRVDIDPSLGAPAMGDAARLRQVVDNLLGNAVKFTDRGRVGLRARRTGGRIVIEVEDTGPGFDTATAELLFSPFVQGEEGPGRRHGGTGLGLSICRRLAALMGGTIGAARAESGGALFRVDLPDEVVVQAPPAPVEPTAPRPAAPAGGTVLLAEDNPVNADVVRRQLERLGYAVVVARDGDEAVGAVEGPGGERFRAVLMDLQMPGRDGLEATRAIRALPGPRADVRIIALTANALAEDREACLASGMDGYLSKPVRLERLGRAIEAGPDAVPDGDRDPAAAGAAVDESVLSALLADLDGDREALGDVVAIWLRELPARREAIAAALRDGDLDELARASHALRSPSATLGVAALAEVCAALERAAREGDLARVGRGADAVAAESERARAALESWAAGPPPG